jgi:hypothetical protein
MGNLEVLARRFAAANLRAQVIGEPGRRADPWRRGAIAPDVFQMTILGEGRDEYFRVAPGAKTNRVEVEGIDRERRQLVLLVHEPTRTFTERLWKRNVQVDRAKVTVIGEDELFVWIEHRTDARKRHFLCGRDERQLFICQLPRPVTTVRDAHAALRAPALARAKEPAVRQGEWFFVPPSRNELAALQQALRELRTVVRTRVPVGPGGHPHVADELVDVPATLVGPILVERTLFARGRVRHQDHDTVRLPAWAKVLRNAEPVADDGIARMDGVRWID